MNRAELEILYDEHAQAVFAYLIRLSRDHEETRDLLQEVFVKLARRASAENKISDPRGFLLRIAHHTWVDLVRRRETGRRIDAALAELPPEQAAVLHLKLRERRTFEQIATILDIPPNTAASRYRYGLDKIRNLLRPLYHELNK